MQGDASTLRRQLAAAILAVAAVDACKKEAVGSPLDAGPAEAPSTGASTVTVASVPPTPSVTPEQALAMRCAALDRCTTPERARGAAQADAGTGPCPTALDPKKLRAIWPDEIVRRGALSFDKECSDRAQGPATCCYFDATGPQRGHAVPGRLLVDEGSVIRPRARLGRRIAARTDATEIVGRAWLEDARIEHASIAAFARTERELVALGAPPSLVNGARSARRDEERHASLCFRLAARHLGVDVAPGDLPSPAARPLDMAALVRTTFDEACVGETLAALAATRALALASDEEAREALRVISTDEARHAELAWATVAWAIAEGGEPAREALRACAGRPPSFTAPPDETDPEILAAHGRLPARDAMRAAEAAWTDIVAPLVRALVA